MYGGTQTEMARLINDSGVMGKAFKATSKNVKDVPFDKMIEAIHKIQDGMGITGTTSKEAMETVAGSIGMAKASLQDFLGGLGNSKADIGQLTKNMVESFTAVVKNIKGVLATMWDNIPIAGWQKNLIAVVAIMGPVLLVIGKMVAIIGGAIKWFGTLGLAITEAGGLVAYFTSPAMLIVGAIVAIIAVGVLLYKNWDTIKAKAEEIFPGIGQGILNVFATIRGYITSFITWITPYFQQGIEFLKSVILAGLDIIKGLWANNGTEIMSTVRGLWEVTQFIFSSGFELLKATVMVGIEFIKLLWNTFGVTVVNLLKGTWEGIKLVFSGGLTFIKGLTEVVLGAINGDWNRVWNGIKTMFSGTVKTLKGLWIGLVTLLSVPLDATVNLLDTFFEEKVAKVKKIWEDLKTFFKNPIKASVNLIKNGTIKASETASVMGAGTNRNIRGIQQLAKGTNNWEGGIVQVHEKGGEIIDLPKGSRVYPHDKSVNMAREQGKKDNTKKVTSTSSIVIAKLADQIIVREEADIDKIAKALVRKLQRTSINAI